MELAVIINDWECIDTSLKNYALRLQTDHHSEVDRLIDFLQFRQGLQPPFTIKKSERPDFIVSLVEAGKTIGIELTWAANQSWEEAIAYILKKNPKYSSISRNWLEGTGKQGKALGEYLKAKQSDTWSWSAADQAIAKAAEIIHAIGRKADDLLDPTYQQMDENWVIISDRSPFLFLDTDEFNRFIVDSLSQNPTPHDKVYFVTQLHDRLHDKNQKVLFDLSHGNCQVVSCLLL